MNASYVSSILLLCLLGLCAVSLSLPAPSSSPEQAKSSHPLTPRQENARQMWNGAKQAMRRLKRRQVVDPPQQPADLESIPGQKVMLDLYKNLSNSTERRNHANTIRSLEYNKADSESCGVFNFSLTSIDSTIQEFYVNAELMLYPHKFPVNSADSHFVEVTAVSWTSLYPIAVNKPTKLTITDAYVVLDVAELTRTLISLGEQYAIFHVKVYKDDPNGPIYLPCGASNAVSFVESDFTDDTKPTYIVYSYNFQIENINYNDIADEVIKDVLTSDSIDEAPAPSIAALGGRRKRQAVPHCQVNQLNIPSDKIHKKIVGSDADVFTVNHPVIYNAGICGGSCSTSVIPETTNHAPFVSLLLGQRAFREKHGYTFQRCCAPVKYKPLMIFSSHDGTSLINVIEDMIITKCECLDIIVLS